MADVIDLAVQDPDTVDALEMEIVPEMVGALIARDANLVTL